jgi:hypothetical protein
MNDTYPANDFYTVQRLSPKHLNCDTDKGINREFSCDYMGSAEFEYGALPASLKRLRTSSTIIIREFPFTLGTITRPVFFIGAQSSLDEGFSDFVTWATAERPFRGQEMTYFPQCFAGTAGEYVTVTAWWSIGDDVFWTLDEPSAESILEAIVPSI